MSVSQGFLDFVLDQLSGLGGVSARRMFGGAGFYRDGRMFALIADDELFLKADEVNRPRLEAAGGHAFRPYPDKPGGGMVMSYWSVPANVLDDRGELAEWAGAAVEAASRKASGARKRAGKKAR